MQRWICKVLYPYPTYQSLLQATSLGCPVSPHLEEEEGDIQGVIQVIQEVHQCQLELLHDKCTLAFQVTLQVRKIHYLANLGLVCILNDLVKKVKIEFTKQVGIPVFFVSFVIFIWAAAARHVATQVK